jgi:hypothetical protein
MIALSLLCFVIVAIAWSRGEASAPRAARACSTHDLDGDYGFSLHGFNPLGQPFGEVGVLLFDGAGTLHGHGITTDAGVRSEHTFTCTYTVNSRCLFTTSSTCVDDGETVAEARLDGVIVENGKELHLMVSGLPPGGAGVAVLTGTAKQK